MKRLHYFQHVPFEGLGSIETWAEDAGFQISGTRFFRNDPLPDVDDLEWLVIMGGPMNIYEESAYPWLRDEKKVIHQAIVRGKTVLGICLGRLDGSRFTKPQRRKRSGWPLPCPTDCRYSTGTATHSICRIIRCTWQKAMPVTTRVLLSTSVLSVCSFTSKLRPTVLNG
jgi:hypothetical protein